MYNHQTEVTSSLLELPPKYPFNRKWRGSDRIHQESQLELGRNCPMKGNKLLVHNLKTELLLLKDSSKTARSSEQEPPGKSRGGGRWECLFGEGALKGSVTCPVKDASLSFS